MWVFIWVLRIINHLGSYRSPIITNNFHKFQIMFLFSWMFWMSTMTKMTFISISKMHHPSRNIVYLQKNFESIPPQTYILWVWQKGWHDILLFFVLPSHGDCFSRVGCSCERWICLPFAISLQKVKSPAKKSTINQQVSLASQMLKNPKFDNTQHVPEIVELNDFNIK